MSDASDDTFRLETQDSCASWNDDYIPPESAEDGAKCLCVQLHPSSRQLYPLCRVPKPQMIR
jgi:hypothetical protein